MTDGLAKLLLNECVGVVGYKIEISYQLLREDGMGE